MSTTTTTPDDLPRAEQIVETVTQAELDYCRILEELSQPLRHSIARRVKAGVPVEPGVLKVRIPSDVLPDLVIVERNGQAYSEAFVAA